MPPPMSFYITLTSLLFAFICVHSRILSQEKVSLLQNNQSANEREERQWKG